MYPYDGECKELHRFGNEIRANILIVNFSISAIFSIIPSNYFYVLCQYFEINIIDFCNRLTSSVTENGLIFNHFISGVSQKIKLIHMIKQTMHLHRTLYNQALPNLVNINSAHCFGSFNLIPYNYMVQVGNRLSTGGRHGREQICRRH